MSESDLVNQARDEARAVIAEAVEQARLILEAADKRQKDADYETHEVREAGRELARNLERSIALLTQILEELRRQLD